MPRSKIVQFQYVYHCCLFSLIFDQTTTAQDQKYLLVHLKMANCRALSSDNEESDEEQHQRDQIQAAVNKGAELLKPERTSISRER